MENMTHLRVELGISGQKIIQQLQINNEVIEDQISKGIKLALEDIMVEDSFIQHVREATKTELASIVNKAVMSWEVRSKIQKLVEEKIGKRVDEYADKIADKITDALK